MITMNKLLILINFGVVLTLYKIFDVYNNSSFWKWLTWVDY